jgi:programmed cell death 6-interacting protein
MYRRAEPEQKPLMPNQLFIPFKKTYDVEIKTAVSDFLQQYTDSHPNAFRWDINRWRTLRDSGTGGAVHVDRIASTLRYAWS